MKSKKTATTKTNLSVETRDVLSPVFFGRPPRSFPCLASAESDWDKLDFHGRWRAAGRKLREKSPALFDKVLAVLSEAAAQQEVTS